jgi:hypothetical protein
MVGNGTDIMTARWCFGLARTWRMSIPITWLCEQVEQWCHKAMFGAALESNGQEKPCIRRGAIGFPRA